MIVTKRLKFAGLAAASLLAAAPTEASTLTLDFNAAVGGTILDSTGAGTGFGTRLSGTGGSIGANDSTLLLDTANGVLRMTTTQSDFNGQGGMGILSAPGVSLSTLGYSGSQDFTATAVFGPIVGAQDIDQLALYVGQNSANLTRDGFITFGGLPEYFANHTTAGGDNNGRFFGFGLNFADGLTLTISRTAGDWQYFIDGLEWQPNTAADGTGTPVDPNGAFGSPNLDALSDLTVGVAVFTPLNANPKTWDLDSFTVTVVPEPSSMALMGMGGLAGMFLRRRRSGV
jgi:arabinan endo-1,5-alpha-L-arabinosidase